MTDPDEVWCSPALHAAHEQLVDAVRHSAPVLPAFDALVEAIVGYGDEDEGLAALDGLVDTELERLGEAWQEPAPVADAGWTARLYAAAMEDFYTAAELDLDAARVRLVLGEMLLDRGLVDEALPLLESAADTLDTAPELLGGVPRHLLGMALRQAGDRSAAVQAFQAAARTSRSQDRAPLAAESFDELAELLRPEDPERAVEAWAEAARLWRSVGEEDAAAASEEGVGWATVDFITTRTDEADVETREVLARRAHEIGLRHNEPLAALAALHLIPALDRRGAYGELATFARFVVDVGERYEEPEFQAMGWAMLSSALTLAGAVEAADDAARHALPFMDALDEPGMTAHLLGNMGALAQMRGDLPASARLFDLAVQLSGGELVGLVGMVAERGQLVQAMAETRVDDARRIAEGIVEAAADDPDLASDKSFALNCLLLMDLATGDSAAALRHEQQLVASHEVELATGDRYARMGVEWVRPMVEAVARGAAGDWDGFEVRLDALRDRLVAEGLGSMAVYATLLAALGDLARGRTALAADRCSAVALALSALVCGPPSSAERAALRGRLSAASGRALECAAACHDRYLISELVEAVRAQAIPVPIERSQDPTLSIASALAMFVEEPGDRLRPWAEQETSLPLPPRVVMPWGATALGRYDSEALGYVPELARAPRVVLQVPR